MSRDCGQDTHRVLTTQEGSNKPYPSTAQKLTCCFAACYKFSTICTIWFSTVCPSSSDPPIKWRIPNLHEGYNMLFGSITSHQHCRWTAGEKVTAQRPDRFFNIPLGRLINWPIGQYQIETVSTHTHKLLSKLHCGYSWKSKCGKEMRNGNDIRWIAEKE